MYCGRVSPRFESKVIPQVASAPQLNNLVIWFRIMFKYLKLLALKDVPHDRLMVVLSGVEIEVWHEPAYRASL